MFMDVYVDFKRRCLRAIIVMHTYVFQVGISIRWILLLVRSVVMLFNFVFVVIAKPAFFLGLGKRYHNLLHAPTTNAHQRTKCKPLCRHTLKNNTINNLPYSSTQQILTKQYPSHQLKKNLSPVAPPVTFAV